MRAISPSNSKQRHYQEPEDGDEERGEEVQGLAVLQTQKGQTAGRDH